MKIIFLRFRHGNKLEIEPNIQEDICKFLKLLKNNSPSEIFKNEIHDISDGSGLGVHPSSTYARTYGRNYLK